MHKVSDIYKEQIRVYDPEPLDSSTVRILTHLSSLLDFKFTKENYVISFTKDGICHTIKYDKDGNVSFYSKDDGYVMDRYNNEFGGISISSSESDDTACLREYDEVGNLVHYKDSSGYEYYDTFDSTGNLISHTRVKTEEKE